MSDCEEPGERLGITLMRSNTARHRVRDGAETPGQSPQN